MSTSKPPLLANATRDLAAFAANLQFTDLPKEVVEKTKYCMLDNFGCCLYGITLPWTTHVLNMVEREGGTPAASIFGHGHKTSVSLAALVNSTAAHAFELDDTHTQGIMHPGALAIPVSMAFAEAAGGAPGRDLITGIVAGYEVGTRVGNAATMSLFYRGFHPQGTSGTFVAAAAAARMLNLDPGRMQHALGIVGSQAGGLMAAQEGAMVKRLHSGKAAQSGVYSAMLAKDGFTGIVDVLEAGYGGYLSSFTDQPDPKLLLAGLGSDWETMKVGFKPYASVASIHTALDALLQIMKENKLVAEDIAEIEAGISDMTYAHCAWEYKAQGVTAAQMNLYYGLSVIALDGMAFVDQYREDRLTDPRILDFIKRIRAVVDKRIDSMGPAVRHGSRVKVKARDGRAFEREILYRRGASEDPLKPAEIEYKFKNVVRSILSQERIDRVMKLVSGIDKADSTRELIEILATSVANRRSAGQDRQLNTRTEQK